MITKKLFLRLCLTAMVFFISFGVNAQVTIGAGVAPQSFSVLELVSNSGGLRLPQLTTAQRDALSGTFGESNADAALALGLVIYNTDFNCLELWNGIQWVSMCSGETPDPCNNLLSAYTLCDSPTPTIADLTAAVLAGGGNGSVKWYNAQTGGNLLAPTTTLTNGGVYWADNCAGALNRTSVTVLFANCAPINPANGFVTAFTNVSYDFQSQELISFTTGSGGVATSWQWQVDNGNGVWQDISGATSATFNIPVDFMYSSYTTFAQSAATPAMANLSFRCMLFNPGSPEGVATNSFDMLFIRTTTSGYSIDANGVRSLVLNRGGGGTVRMALLNVGATDTDGIGLGNLFQWGRIADGHEQIVWNKNAGGTNIITPMDGVGTSSVVPRTDVVQIYDANLQIADASGIGNFISNNNGDWGTQDTPSNQRWGLGTGTITRANAPTSITQWAFPTNNPCPSGWRVPNRFEFWDINNGDGTNNTMFVTSWNISTVSGNTWIWRGATNGSVGGAIVTNSNGEAVFLPAVGSRSGTPGTLGRANNGDYWSSTHAGTSHAQGLSFSSTSVSAGNFTSPRSSGRSVRCVAE